MCSHREPRKFPCGQRPLSHLRVFSNALAYLPKNDAPLSVYALRSFRFSRVQTDQIWIRGHYDPDTSNDEPAVSGLGSSCLSVVGSTVSKRRL